MIDLQRIVFVAMFVTCAGCQSGADSETQRQTVEDAETGVVPDGASSTSDASALDVPLDATVAEGARNCEDATALTADVPIREQAIASIGTAELHCRPSDTASRFYRFDIPPHMRATFVVTPVSRPAWSAVVRMSVACDAQECVADGVSPQLGAPVEITIDNSEEAPLHKIVSVSPESAGVNGAFDIVVHLGDSSAGDAGPASDATDACDSAIEVTNGTHLAREIVGSGVRASFPCERTESGRPHDVVARMYRVDVPAGDYLRVTARPSGSIAWLPGLFILDDCGGTSCADQLAPFYAEQFGYTVSTVNRSAAAATKLIVVATLASDAMAGSETFDLDVALEAPAPNATCENATTLASGARLVNIANSGGRDVLTSCGRTSLGSALYYRVHVPAGSWLTARGTRADGETPWNVTSRLFDGCGALSTCLASATLVDEPAQLTYRNTTTTAQDIVLAATGENTDAHSNLAVEVWNEPFAISRIAGACEDLAGGASVLEDASYSPRMPLPISFPFMGDTMTWFATHGTGRIGLFTSGDGAADGQHGDMPIPAFAENLAASIAPFWAFTWPAERTPYGGRSDVVMKVFDGIDRHVTFEFRDWSFLEDETARVTFQARLYATGTIEFHYCQASGSRGDLTSGASATIGVQSSDGFRGAQIARHTAGMIAPGMAFRLVPNE